MEDIATQDYTKEIHLLISSGKLPNLSMDFYKKLCDELGFKDPNGNPLNFNSDIIIFSSEQYDTIRYNPKLHSEVVDSTISKLINDNSEDFDKQSVIFKYDELINKYSNLLSKLSADSKCRDNISEIIKNIETKKNDFLGINNPVENNVSVETKESALIKTYENKIERIRDNISSAKREVVLANKISKLRFKKGFLSTKQAKIVNKNTVKYIKIMSSKSFDELTPKNEMGYVSANVLAATKEKVSLNPKANNEQMSLRIQKILDSGKKIVCNLSDQFSTKSTDKVFN